MSDFIRTDDDLARHINALAYAHSSFQPLVQEAGPVPLRWLDRGFKGLCWVVTGQQISVSAGQAIFGRLEAAVGEITPERLAETPDETLRSAGFSASKIRTLRTLQQAILTGELDLPSLEAAPADEAISKLCEIKGVGPWTAEVYLLFAAGHPDIFPAADIALQEAARLAFDLNQRPTPKEFRIMAQSWSPWRSAAARLLWAFYRVRKSGKGMPLIES